jgi:hypothetical protein
MQCLDTALQDGGTADAGPIIAQENNYLTFQLCNGHISNAKFPQLLRCIMQFKCNLNPAVLHSKNRALAIFNASIECEGAHGSSLQHRHFHY